MSDDLMTAAPLLIAQGESWYTGTNIPGKPRSFMVHVDYPAYVARCETVAATGYAGFHRTRTAGAGPA